MALNQFDCVVCLIKNVDGLSILDANGSSEKIADILIKYFWSEIVEPQSDSRFVCVGCWTKIRSFHEFYQMVEHEHKKSTSSKVPKIETDNSPKESFQMVKVDLIETVNPVDVIIAECPPSDNDSIKDDSDNFDLNDGGNDTDDSTSEEELKTEILVVEKSSKKQRHLRSSSNKESENTVKVEESAKDEQDIQCDVCGKSFNSFKNLNRHSVMHEPKETRKFECLICKKKFPRKFTLNSHLRSSHLTENDVSCPVCHKTLKASSLKVHVATIHENAPRKAEPSICEICAKVFNTKSGLSQHLQTHVDIKETRTQCHVCGTWLKNEYLLKTHVRRIHNAKPLKCPHCDKIKPNRNSLSRHISESHSAPSHHCTYCDKAFVRAISLKEHIASHTGDCLYSCAYCPRTFNSNSNMYKHMKRKHFEQWNADRVKKT